MVCQAGTSARHEPITRKTMQVHGHEVCQLNNLNAQMSQEIEALQSSMQAEEIAELSVLRQL